MKPTKKLVAEVLKVYNSYWESYTRGDLKTFAGTLDKTFEMIGTSESEICHSKEEGIKFLKAQVKELVGKVEMRKRHINVVPVNEHMLVNERSDIYILTGKRWSFYAKIRISTLLRNTPSGWKVFQQHGSFPDMRVQEGETLALEKISRENSQLREAVKRRTIELEEKNRELEIDKALEKVRTVAMGMKMPADMLQVCTRIAQELDLLGVKEIRNVQTAIFNVPRGTYMNYEYYAKHKRTFITETTYTNHKVARDFAATMLKGKGGVSITYIKGKQKVKKWLDYQKGTNVFIDTYLNTAISLTYYWYSLGPVALGISTYTPLTKEDQELFKRFLKVFEMAYRRYLDIELAEAQAKEAQIETALERIRTRALAMHHSDELTEVAKVLREQMGSLGQQELETSAVHLYEEDPATIFSWRAFRLSRDLKSEISYGFFKIPKNAGAIAREFVQKFESKAMEYTIEVSGAEQREWYKVLFKLAPEVHSAMKKSGTIREKRYYHFSKFSGGALLMVSSKAPAQVVIELQKRAAQVFDLAYRRFKDLQRAEAQARESQVQLALERVRARTMAMQHSEELSETVAVLFEQFKALGEEPERMAIEIVNEKEHVFDIWATQHGGAQLNSLAKISLDEPHVMQKMYKAWKARKRSITIDLQGAALEKYFRFLKNAGLPVQRKAFGKRRVQNVATFSKGILTIITPEPRPQETIVLLERFAAVFDGTYTRFLDLQKAEAQAREAEIELGLERVRARAMAMRSSDELKVLIGAVFTELTKLDLALTRCIIWVFEPATQAARWWMANSEEPHNPMNFFIKYHKHPAYLSFVTAWKKQQVKLVYDLRGRDKASWDEILFNETELANLPGIVKKGMRAPERVILSGSFNNFGGINTASLEPLSEEHFDILLRFAKVFDLTYTRFLDLQKAEAQAREAQIETALERVRSRSMAMHNSAELGQVIRVLTDQLTQLGFHFDTANFITNESMPDWEIWISSPEQAMPPKIHVPYIDHPLFNERNTDLLKGRDMITAVLDKKEKNRFFRHMFTNTAARGTPEERKAWVFSQKGLAITTVLMKTISLSVLNYDAVPYTTEENEVIKRMGRVFEQSYTRFLDLQKAEAQARESQIQLALERVRARTMAMQKSDELPETSHLLFQQMKGLGEPAEQLTIGVVDEENNVMEISATLHGDMLKKIYLHSIDEPFMMRKVYNAWKNHQKTLVVELKGGELNAYNAYRNKLTKSEIFPENLGEEDRRIVYVAFFSKGLLALAAHEPRPQQSLELLERFASVFDLTYTRFLDLQKAEAQAKEAQIETALERVRSRSMGMQKSEELKEVIRVVYEQFVHLNIRVEHAGFIMDYKEREDMHIWLADQHRVPSHVVIPYFDSAHWNSFIDARKKGIDFFVNQLGFAEKNRFYQELFTLFPVPDEAKEYYFNCPGLAISTVLLDNVGLYIENFAGTPYTEEENAILRRFGKVFQQTYTRFLDLQKAEAQAREAKIETALEKIRSRTMAMQHSNELPEAANLLFLEVQALGIPSWSCGYNILDDDKKASTCIMSSEGQLQSAFHLPFTNSGEPSFAAWLEAIENDQPFLVQELSGKALDDHYNYMKTLPQVGQVIKELENAGISLPTYQINHLSFFNGGFLLFITYEQVPHAHDIFKRFTTVFEQTYTRFLDLQKAEVQAREAQIELGLERVRARAMAMHKSEELADLSLELVKQVQALGVATWFCAFNIYDDDPQGSLEWGSNGRGTFPKYRTPREGIFLQYYNAGQRGENFLVHEIGEKECPAHYEYLCSLPGVGEQLLKMKEAGIPFPVSQIDHVAYFRYGYILFITFEPVAEAHDIFKRFAKVFEQTYTRFLDLQKAEAQAREAQIEMSLERVRSKTMAMHNSQEVGATVASMFEEMVKLDVDKTIRCGVAIFLNPGEIELWTAYSDQPGNITLNIGKLGTHLHPLLQGAADGWMRKETEFTYVLEGQDVIDYYTSISNAPDYPFRIDLDTLPPKVFHHDFYFSEGSLFAFAREPMAPAVAHLFKRFAAVFGQTYRRYLDLQKAEAQVREAQIEAALEKVRSRTMAMQSSNELQETAALLFQEFKKLGTTDMYQFTIGIYDEETQKIDFRSTSWANNGEQESRSFHLDMNEPTLLQPVVNAWKAKQKSVVIDLSGEALEKWLDYRNQMSGVTVKSSDTAGRRVITVAFYSKGHLSISTPQPVPAETKHTLERFAAVFDVTYTRFLDLEKAEAQAREAQIEAALERVRSRTLAMQKSDELSETAAEVFKQLIGLGIEPNRLYIGIVHPVNKEMEMWATDEDGSKVGKKFSFNAADNASVERLYDGWEKKMKSVTVDMEGRELEEYIHYLQGLQIPVSHALTQKRRVQTVAYFDKGFIGMASPEDQPKETTQLLERFAAVFNLTFTRFNDLKIAEAHAQQAEQDLVEIRAAKQKAEAALTELQATQNQLVQSEKMASLGELTAGIAHEIQNPLNFVNNFSEVSNELIQEMLEEVEKGNFKEVKALADDVRQNLEKINHHGKRADGIVKGMLQHSRTSSGQKELTDINALCDEYLRLAYHGLRAKDKSFNAKFETNLDASVGKIQVMPQDMGRVILNLINNAFYAVSEKKALASAAGRPYEPTVTVSTQKNGDMISIRVNDNGNGIPPRVLDKIFQPFFTTKPTGQGTGLGLSLSYDIVKAHGGELRVETTENIGTTFIISLPV